MRRKKIVRTKNREIYEKFNLLHFSKEVIMSKPSKYQIGRILKNINKDMEVLETKDLGDYIIVKKKGPINFKIYLS
jgi:hypothetical protein